MATLQWRKDWEKGDHAFCPVSPPPHPTYDLYKVIDDALAEDAGDLGDITTFATIPAATEATATFIAKAQGILAGAYVADAVFRRVDASLTLQWLVDDSTMVTPGQVIGTVTGKARSILIAERIALNFMQRMSGIATLTASMEKAVKCTRATLLDTRKTVPGLRLLDKWAVKIGGGGNHRLGLYDMIMVKDNHIAAAGGIVAALDAVKTYMNRHKIERPVEVETRTLQEVEEVVKLLDSGSYGCITRIMLDNMTRKDADRPSGIDVSTLKAALDIIGDRSVETEASGNVTLATVGEIAKTGVQFISCGALTHSVTALDISLLIETSRDGSYPLY